MCLPPPTYCCHFLSQLSLHLHPSSRKKPHIFELNWTLFFLPYYNCPCDFHSLKCACLFNDAVSDPEWFNAFYTMENSRPIWSYFIGIINKWKISKTRHQHSAPWTDIWTRNLRDKKPECCPLLSINGSCNVYECALKAQYAVSVRCVSFRQYQDHEAVGTQTAETCSIFDKQLLAHQK